MSLLLQEKTKNNVNKRHRYNSLPLHLYIYVSFLWSSSSSGYFFYVEALQQFSIKATYNLSFITLINITALFLNSFTRVLVFYTVYQISIQTYSTPPLVRIFSNSSVCVRDFLPATISLFTVDSVHLHCYSYPQFAKLRVVSRVSH